jgi:tripartite-type tricarboxylate transporter receptor subunit TctC
VGIKAMKWLVAALAGWLVAGGAMAQGRYPERPILMVYPYAAGGAADVMARAVGDKLRVLLGQPVVTESKPGAGGAIGTAFVARAKPDGYTLLMGATGSHTNTPFAMDNPGFDPVKDFQVITALTRQPMAFVVNPAFPAKDLRELTALVRANPGKYAYASAGSGALAHLGMELYKMRAGGLQMTHAPYKGGAPAMNDVIAGHVPMLLDTLSTVLEQHRAGRIRIVAILSPDRSSRAPDIPTGIEQGIAGLDVQTCFFLFAPAGTPQPIMDVLAQASMKVAADADFQKFAAERGIEVMQDMTPAKSAIFVRGEIDKWSQVIKAVGLKL